MKNSLFNIQFCEADGTVASLCLTADKDVMNWCAEDGKWGCIHHVNYDNIGGGTIKAVKEKWNLSALQKPKARQRQFMQMEFCR